MAIINFCHSLVPHTWWKLDDLIPIFVTRQKHPKILKDNVLLAESIQRGRGTLDLHEEKTELEDQVTYNCVASANIENMLG